MFSLVCLSKRMMFSYAPILYLCTVLCLCLIDQSAQTALIPSIDALTDDINEFTVRCEAEVSFGEYDYISFSANKTLLHEDNNELFGTESFFKQISDYDTSNITDSIASFKKKDSEYFELTVKNPRSRLDAMTCHIGSQIIEKAYLPYLRIVDFKIAPLPDRQYYALCQTDVNRNESAFYLDKEPFEYRVSLQYQDLTLAEYYHLEDSTNLQNSTLNIYHSQYVVNGKNVGSQHSFVLREREGLKYNFDSFTCNLSYKNTTTKSKAVTLIEFRNETNPCANQYSDFEYEYILEESVEIVEYDIEYVDGVDGGIITNYNMETKHEETHDIQNQFGHEYTHDFSDKKRSGHL